MYVVLNVVATSCVDVDKEIWMKLKAENPDKTDGELFSLYKKTYIETDERAWEKFVDEIYGGMEIDDYRPIEVRSYVL